MTSVYHGMHYAIVWVLCLPSSVSLRQRVNGRSNWVHPGTGNPTLLFGLPGPTSVTYGSLPFLSALSAITLISRWCRIRRGCAGASRSRLHEFPVRQIRSQCVPHVCPVALGWWGHRSRKSSRPTHARFRSRFRVSWRRDLSGALRRRRSRGRCQSRPVLPHGYRAHREWSGAIIWPF